MANLLFSWPAWALACMLLALLAWRWRRGRQHARRAWAAAQQQLAQQEQQHAAELQAAVAAAEKADLAKTRFLAAASHDLRQPAHALGLYLAALRAGPLAPEQAEVAQRMGAALEALDGLFEALLDVSRIDADAVVPRWRLQPLAPLLRRLADEHAGAAEARGLRLSLRLSPQLADPAAHTVTDAFLLERVLRNLLSNAVQHTHSGGVLLACRQRSAADGTPHWRIEVWDSGVGIAPADQALVFEEFQQLGRGQGGLGLGLAIARRLSQLLQLRLTLHSRPGRGSVFFVDGLAVAGPAPLQADAARREGRRLAGACIAVLDDDAEVRDATRRLLQRWDCQVLDGADAAALLQQGGDTVPQALIADLRLADGRRGTDEARALFAAWGRAVPLLLVSGDLQAAPPADLRAICLAKPLSPARLRAWLEQSAAHTTTEDPACTL